MSTILFKLNFYLQFFSTASWTPRSLQELCRSLIRRRLRKTVWAENKNLVEKQPLTPSSEDEEVTFLGWQSEVVIPINRDGCKNLFSFLISLERILDGSHFFLNEPMNREVEKNSLFL